MGITVVLKSLAHLIGIEALLELSYHDAIWLCRTACGLLEFVSVFAVSSRAYPFHAVLQRLVAYMHDGWTSAGLH